MMLLFKALGAICILGAFACAGVDGMNSLANDGGLAFSSFGEHWQKLHPTSLAAFASFISSFNPALWTNGFATLFALPAWLLLAIFGFIFFSIVGFMSRGSVYSN